MPTTGSQAAQGQLMCRPKHGALQWCWGAYVHTTSIMRWRQLLQMGPHLISWT